MPDTLSIFYFPAAVLLGALHAMEPGHAKVLTASYLIGIKGTTKDALLLGLSVALTHSIVVVSISAIGLWVGSAAFTTEATEWLARASAVIALAIGFWMLWRRLYMKKGTCHHDHGQHDSHSHDYHQDDIAHTKAHEAHLPEYIRTGKRPSRLQIIGFGVTGGMIPCPASITVMLLAISVGKVGMGFFTVMGFSLGLSIALVGLGVLVVSGLQQFEKNERLSWITKKAPIFSAGLVILSGLFALLISFRPHA